MSARLAVVRSCRACPNLFGRYCTEAPIGADGTAPQVPLDALRWDDSRIPRWCPLPKVPEKEERR